LFAQSIHNASLNCDAPFVAINCAAIPENLLESILFGVTKGAFTGAESSPGLFEQAGKGSIFLYEINSMPHNLQAKLLRAIQERSVRRIGSTSENPIKCRIMSSTNADPWQCVCSGIVRQDLFYRLSALYLHIPPLRERVSDVILLGNYFLRKYAKLYGKKNIKLSEELTQLMVDADWKGNVRELEHVIESSVAMLEPDEETITINNLPPYIRAQMVPKIEPPDALVGLEKYIKYIEKRAIKTELEKHNWNISQTAKVLKITRQSLQRKIIRLKISKT
jgi:arginine utilization regulatory protein